MAGLNVPPADSVQQLSKLLVAVPTVLSLEKMTIAFSSNSKPCKQEKIVSPLRNLKFLTRMFHGPHRYSKE